MGVYGAVAASASAHLNASNYRVGESDLHPNICLSIGFDASIGASEEGKYSDVSFSGTAGVNLGGSSYYEYWRSSFSCLGNTDVHTVRMAMYEGTMHVCAMSGFASPHSEFDNWFVQSVQHGYYPEIRVGGSGGSGWLCGYALYPGDGRYHLSTIDANVGYTHYLINKYSVAWLERFFGLENWWYKRHPAVSSEHFEAEFVGSLQVKMSSIPYDLAGTGIRYEETQPPVASFTYSPEFPVVGGDVAFDASSSYDPDGEIVSYLWDFGDGNSTVGQVVTHSYGGPGAYDVSLMVTDNGAMSTVQVLSAYVIIKSDIPIPDSAPPSGTPKDGDVNGDGKNDWLLTSIADDEGNKIELWVVDPDGIPSNLSPLSPIDEYYALLFKTHASEKYYVGRCPFSGGRNAGWYWHIGDANENDIMDRFVGTEWISLDGPDDSPVDGKTDGLERSPPDLRYDDDRDGKTDVFVYKFNVFTRMLSIDNLETDPVIMPPTVPFSFNDLPPDMPLIRSQPCGSITSPTFDSEICIKPEFRKIVSRGVLIVHTRVEATSASVSDLKLHYLYNDTDILSYVPFGNVIYELYDANENLTEEGNLGAFNVTLLNVEKTIPMGYTICIKTHFKINVLGTGEEEISSLAIVNGRIISRSALFSIFQ